MFCVTARLQRLRKSSCFVLGHDFKDCRKMQETKGTGLPVPHTVKNWTPLGAEVRLFRAVPFI
jgi:hypothetical protein